MVRLLRQLFKRIELKTFLLNFIFMLSLYYFNFLEIKVHNLEPIGPEIELTYSLVKTVINEVPVFHSKSFSISHVTKALNFIQHYFMSTDHNNIHYNLSKFRCIDGSYFDRKSHLNHYNFYLSFQECGHTIFTHQLTHISPSTNLFEFKLFSENDIAQKHKDQYISSCIRIIESTYIEPFNDAFVSKNDLLKYTAKNNLKITKFFKNSINIE